MFSYQSYHNNLPVDVEAFNYSTDILSKVKSEMNLTLKDMDSCTKRLKDIISISTDIATSMPTGAIRLQDIDIVSSDGIVKTSTGINIKPDIVTTKIMSAEWSSSVNPVLNNDTGNKSVLYTSNDIIQNREFGFTSINPEESIFMKPDTEYNVVFIKKSNRLTSSKTKVLGVRTYENSSYDTIYTEDGVYVIFDNLTTEDIEIRLQSNDRDGDLFKFLISGLSIGISKYNDKYTTVFGPIKASGKIIKVGIYSPSMFNSEYYISKDTKEWTQVDKNSSDSYLIDINSIYSNINLDTNTIYIKTVLKPSISENTRIIKKVSNSTGTDVSDINTLAGGRDYGRTNIIGLTYLLQDILSQRNIYTIDASKKYISNSQHLTISTYDTFTQNYKTDIFVDPVKNDLKVGTGLRGDTNGEIKVFKLSKTKVGRYIISIDENDSYIYSIYGKYVEDVRAYTFVVDKGSSVIAKYKNANTFEEIKMEKIGEITDHDIYNLIATTESFEKVLSDTIFNSARIINNSIDTYQTHNNSNTFLGIYDSMKSDFMINCNAFLDRGRIINLESIMIKEVTMPQELSERAYINGVDEFKMKRQTVKSVLFSSKSYSANWISDKSSVLIYKKSFGYKLLQVFSEENLLNDDSFYVNGDTITISDNLIGSVLHIEVATKDSDIMPNLYSVDYREGVVYFSTNMNSLSFSYKYMDLIMSGKIYTVDNIESEDAHITYDIVEEEVVSSNIINKSVDDVLINVLRGSI